MKRSKNNKIDNMFNMNKNELRKFAIRRISEINKKIPKLEKTGDITPALEKLRHSLKINFKNLSSRKIPAPSKKMSTNDIRKLVAIAENFDKSKSSTRKGMIEVIDNRSRAILKKYTKLRKGDLPMLYKLFANENIRRAAEIHRLSSEEIASILVEYISNSFDSSDIETVFNWAIENENDEYILDFFDEFLER